MSASNAWMFVLVPENIDVPSRVLQQLSEQFIDLDSHVP